MITSVFKKSAPINLFLVVILMLLFFSIIQIQDLSWTTHVVGLLQRLGMFVLLLGSIFVTNFVAKKNGLSKDSAYTLLFYFLFLLFFPSVWNNWEIMASNFFILLAFRRLLSLQSLKATSEKIFDASLWVFVASLFHFWSILYLVLVFVSIFFHVARDYRNWVLPFIALFAVIVISLALLLVLQVDIQNYISTHLVYDFHINYFTNNYQNAAFAVYITAAIFFVFSMFVFLSSKPLVLHTSYKMILLSFFIGILVYVVTSNKSNDMLVYTIAPLSIMATSHIEEKQPLLHQELVLGILLVCSLILFFLQL